MRSSSPQKKRCVICFSSRDADGKLVLAAHLAAARRSVSLWSVDEVPAGSSVQAAWKEAAAGADAAFLLLSANFFKDLDDPAFSEQVDELRRQHRERGLWIEALVWRPCAWEQDDWLPRLVRPVNSEPLASMSSAQRDAEAAKIVRRLCRRWGEQNTTMHWSLGLDFLKGGGR